MALKLQILCSQNKKNALFEQDGLGLCSLDCGVQELAPRLDLQAPGRLWRGRQRVLRQRGQQEEGSGKQRGKQQ